jgi:hypothetical protein
VKITVRDLQGKGVPVTFGPVDQPNKFEIDLLVEAQRRLTLGTFKLDDFQLVIGDRLGESPYPVTDRTTMPPNYQCEGSVWLSLYRPDGRDAGIGVVPFLHKSDTHHNFWLYWRDFDGSKDATKYISGHQIPIDDPVVIKITLAQDVRTGTIAIRES